MSPMICPVCTSVNTERFLTLENMPSLGNLLWDSPEDAVNIRRVRMDLRCCDECGHVFNESFDPYLITYSGTYENSLYFSPHFRSYALEAAERTVNTYGLAGKDILEIGCGKGDFLAMITEIAGGRGTGFDTSYTGGYEHRKDLTFIRDFYSEKYSGVKADLVICRQVLEHIPRPGLFLDQVSGPLGTRGAGILLFEVPNALSMLERLQFQDLIYEHCGYFTPSSLGRLFSMHGLEVLDIRETYDRQYLALHARKASGAVKTIETDADPAVAVAAAQAFARAYERTIEGWRRFIFTENAGKNIVLWGAGTKGISFAHMTGLNAETVPFIVDLNVRKHGKYLTGSGQLIIPPERLRSVKPDIVVIMNPVYSREIRDELARMDIDCETVVFDRTGTWRRVADGAGTK